MGDRELNLALALKMLSDFPSTRLLAASAVCETEPVGVPPEFASQKFLNQVAIFETELGALDFSNRMHAVEDVLGRVRTVRNGPRTIDVDLILFDDLTVDSDDLTLPHPRARERDFVMSPLRECIEALSVSDFSLKMRMNVLMQTINQG